MVILPATYGYLNLPLLTDDLEGIKSSIQQLAHAKKLGHVDWIEETVSGRVHWQERVIGRMMEQTRERDNVIVPALSDLGRSMVECIEILSFVRQKGLHIYAVKSGWELDDRFSPELLEMMFGVVDEIERDLISRRTKAALRARKEAGVKLGRPIGVGKSKLDPYRGEIENLLNHGSTQRYIARRYDTTEANLSRWLKKHGLRRK